MTYWILVSSLLCICMAIVIIGSAMVKQGDPILATEVDQSLLEDCLNFLRAHYESSDEESHMSVAESIYESLNSWVAEGITIYTGEEDYFDE